jgi:hypothetical protein
MLAKLGRRLLAACAPGLTPAAEAAGPPGARSELIPGP